MVYNKKFYIGISLFTITGVIQDLMYGAFISIGLNKKPWNSVSMILFYYPSILFSAFLPGVLYSFRWSLVYRLKPIIFLEFLALSLWSISNTWLGPGLVAIIYSSVTPFTVLNNFLFFRKKLSFYRILSVFIIMGGISLCSMDQLNEMNNDLATISGIITMTISAFLYGLTYTTYNAVFDADTSLPPAIVAFHKALILGMIWTFIVLLVNIIKWYIWVLEPVQEAKKDIHEIVSYIITMFIMNGLHEVSWAFIMSFGKKASVTAGVLKALQAVCTFTLSSLFWCDSDKAQCMTKWKNIGCGITSFGIVSYGIPNLVKNYSSSESDLDTDSKITNCEFK